MQATNFRTYGGLNCIFKHSKPLLVPLCFFLRETMQTYFVTCLGLASYYGALPDMLGTWYKLRIVMIAKVHWKGLLFSEPFRQSNQPHHFFRRNSTRLQIFGCNCNKIYKMVKNSCKIIVKMEYLCKSRVL